MGRPKALLPVGGTTLIEWTVGRLRSRFAETLVAAATKEQVPAALRAITVLDERPGAGPLAGIEAGLRSCGPDAVFAIACDLPGVDAGLAEDLLARLPGHQAVVPEVNGRLQPTAAIYHRSALSAIASALDGGERAAMTVLERLSFQVVARTDARTFTNMNSPEDYRAFLDNWM